MKKILTFCVLVFMTNYLLYSAERESEKLKTEKYVTVLENYVDSQGFVNYKQLKKNIFILDDFLLSLKNYKFPEYSSLNKKEKIIFWINVHNASVLKFVAIYYPIKSKPFSFLSKYPQNSVKQLRNFDKVKIYAVEKERTLRQIKQKILELGDSRALFALTFACKSSPVLKNSIYEWELLPRDLNEQVRRFLANESNYRLDTLNSIVYISNFLKEHALDLRPRDKNLPKYLEKEDRNVINFIFDYIPEKDREYLKKAYYAIQYVDFEWELNEQEIE
ncbi:DUF547 domain-containing protein [bacterium]